MPFATDPSLLASVDVGRSQLRAWTDEVELSGLPTAELLDRQSARWRRLLSSAQLVVRVHQENLPQIVADGRLRSQHETGTSAARLDAAYRRDVEARLFGQTSHDPIYGYVLGTVGAGKSNAPVRRYGSALLVLKDSVRPRASVLAYDSLGGYSQWTQDGDPMHGCPELIDQVTHRSLVRPLPEGDSLHETTRGFPRPFPFGYCEAQIHGGLAVDDIACVVFEKAPSPELAALLAVRGIACSVQPDIEVAGRINPVAPDLSAIDRPGEPAKDRQIPEVEHRPGL
jgi:hypothetical protein